MAGKEGEAVQAEIIKWNEEAERFETADGRAYLQYCLVKIGEGRSKSKSTVVMDMAHTFVPPFKRGMGLAAKLCDAAFAHAQRMSLPVVPTCSYISDTYLPKNPAWNSLIYKEEPKSSM